MENVNQFLNAVIIICSIILFCMFLRPFIRKFYSIYIDKSPIKITLNGNQYTFDRKSKIFIIDQIKEQDEKRESEKNLTEEYK